MRFEQDRLGYAFEDDYPESYGPADNARLRAILPQQVERLGSTDRATDERLLGILIGRRCGDPDRAQLEQRPRRDGVYTLVARGEIVLPAESYAAVKDLLADYTPQAGTSGTHVRLRRPAFSAFDVDRSVDACAAAKVDAWPNYVATMAAVGKGVGGPEPAPPPPPPPVTDGLRAARRSVRVAVIDTGIAAQTRTDGLLNDVSRGDGAVDRLDVLPAGPDGLLDYGAGHGTFVSGIIARVAPHATIAVYQAADTDGLGTDDEVADAILRADADGAQIINLSLAIRTVDDQPPPAIAAAVATVRTRSGGATVIVAAAGNYGDRTTVFPAALDGVEAVAGLTAHLTPATWSSYGDVQFSTVAEGIHSTFVQGTESPVFDPAPDAFGPDAWAIWSGTSFAAPQIAGAVARISYEQDLDVRVALEKLASFGKPIAGYGNAMRILKGIG
jgi:thermitase